MAQHHVTHAGEPEPRALSTGLRREIGLEDALLRVVVHADAGVADHERDGGDGAGLVWQLGVGRSKTETTAVGHRVARVRREVQEDQLELTLIGQHRRACRRGGHDELDVLADEATQHGLDLAQEPIEADRRGGRGLAPREGEQLTDQRSGAPPGELDHLELFVERGRAPMPPDHLDAAEDRREQVVEVVGDAAGEPSEGLHLGGLPAL